MNKVIAKVEEIIAKIESSDEYQKYLLLEEKICDNSEIKTLINRIKLLQKDIVHGMNKEKELDDCLELLNSNPLYREYLNAIYEINNIYTIIENTLNNYFDSKLN